MLGGGAAALRPNIDPTKSGGATGGATPNAPAKYHVAALIEVVGVTMRPPYHLRRDFQLSQNIPANGWSWR